MPVFVLQGIVSKIATATFERGGARYDYLEIVEQGGSVRRLSDVFVPARLRAEIALYAIGEFHCQAAAHGISPANEIFDFRRADRPIT